VNPIYNEYLTFLRDTTKQPLEDLKEGYFWLDKSIIKGFDKQGNEHKFYRVKIENSLERLVYFDFSFSSIIAPQLGQNFDFNFWFA
jgi:hypothetical protein